MHDIRKTFKSLEYYWEKYLEAKKTMTSVQFNDYISQFSAKNNINIRYGYCVDLDKEISISDTVRVIDVSRRVEEEKKKFFGTKKIVTYTIYVESMESRSDRYFYQTSLTTKDDSAEKLNKGDMLNIMGSVKVRYCASETHKFEVYDKGLLFSKVS